MRCEALLGALVILSDLAGPARADLVGKTVEPPQFSATDHRTIGRNELLRTIVDDDPWLVRRILDLMARRSGPRPYAPDDPLPDGVDPGDNPDLTGRTAEGSVEWLELLKRARSEKDAREKEPAVGARSAEGSVELIEMMKKAKAAKEAVEK